jgi:nucleoside phosphorylase
MTPIDILSAKNALHNNYILLLTTNSIERKAVNDALEHTTRATVSAAHRGANLGLIDDHFCIHLTGDAGASAPINVGKFARLMTNGVMPRPALVMLVGFGWGNPNCVEINDIILSPRIENISHQRAVQGSDFRRNFPYMSPLGDLSELCQSLAGTLPIHHGALASAELYLGDDRYRDTILRQFPEVLGGEMEAFDVVKDISVPWIVLKGVSDYGGTGTDQSQQSAAAEGAASLIEPILNLLVKSERLAAPSQHLAAQQLVDTLTGDAITISHPQGDREEITNILNQEVVPILIMRLGAYASDADSNGKLPKRLGVLIAEIAQNAFIHGGANSMVCEFNEATISLTDDGRHFDVSSLAGNRGGAHAWKLLKSDFPGDSTVKYIHEQIGHKGNKYSFKLKMLSAEIRQARSNCAIVWSYTGPGSKPYSYDENCETLYYDATDVFMPSKRFQLNIDLTDVLRDGKKLFIACRDLEQVDELGGDLLDFLGPNLRIFVRSSA